MKHIFTSLALVSFLLPVLYSCIGTGKDSAKKSTGAPSFQSPGKSVPSETGRPACNSIYHWKTTFDPDDNELAFLKKHSIGRMYIRLFDVDLVSVPTGHSSSCVPIGTTKFMGKVPDGVEVVPTVFITTKAVMHASKEPDGAKILAQKIYRRIRNMADCNELGKYNEIQLDCDWTSSTEKTYFAICREIKSLADTLDIEVSSTIRLH